MTTETKVKDMYSDFVYPKYDEQWDEEAPEFNKGYFYNLNTLRHYIYKGKKNFDNFKMLSAGCGLGSVQ